MFERACKRKMLQASFAGALATLAMTLVLFIFFQIHGFTLPLENTVESVILAGVILLVTGGAVFILSQWRAYASYKQKIHFSKSTLARLDDARKSVSITQIEHVLAEAKQTGSLLPIVQEVTRYYQPILQQRIHEIAEQERAQKLRVEFEQLKCKNKKRLARSFENEPLIAHRRVSEKALFHVSGKLAFMQERRQAITELWDQRYEEFSWWNKIKYSGGPDYSEIDNAIASLKALKFRLNHELEADLSELEDHYSQLNSQLDLRLEQVEKNLNDLLDAVNMEDRIAGSMIEKTIWLSAMSVPVSVWLDVDNALDVYNALRSVNQNYADLSASEIFFQTLLMPTDSLDGLAALTKGAYFETLVAVDTGGELHEHFNAPDTDITIEGVEYQLKATDSVSYVESVDVSIPVISTSEVALVTGAMDSGYSNEDLTHTVDLALGGTVIDTSDTAVDALLTGLGGLGFFATLQGINHACKKYENGGEAVESMFEGLGVAIEGTARALVGAAEMSYNVLTSSPSRFIVSSVGKGIIKLDKKLSGV